LALTVSGWLGAVRAVCGAFGFGMIQPSLRLGKPAGLGLPSHERVADGAGHGGVCRQSRHFGRIGEWFD
jgi:hypothetical protein